MSRRPARRACFEPRVRPRRCRASQPAVRGAQLLASRRARSACRVREDFTGRGFGTARLRDAR